MSKAYICSVSSPLKVNYEIGLLKGLWGVETAYRGQITPVKPGDLLIFVVDGRFRSIHPILSDVFHDQTLVWPLKAGDPFPYRVQIGAAQVRGSVPVAELAPSISFMRGKVWGGTLRGRNGVFNRYATPQDVQLITQAVLASSAAETESSTPPITPPNIVAVSPTFWLPGFLDQLAGLVDLRATATYGDPFEGANVLRQGLLTGVYTDRSRTPTVAVSPVDRTPEQTIISTLFGLSAVKQASPTVKEVRGVIFVHERHEELVKIIGAVPNVTTVPYEVHVSLRR